MWAWPLEERPEKSDRDQSRDHGRDSPIGPDAECCNELAAAGFEPNSDEHHGGARRAVAPESATANACTSSSHSRSARPHRGREAVIDLQDQRQSDCDFGSSHGQNEQEHDLAVRPDATETAATTNARPAAVEHDLQRHAGRRSNYVVRARPVSPSENKYSRQYQSVAHGYQPCSRRFSGNSAFRKPRWYAPTRPAIKSMEARFHTDHDKDQRGRSRPPSGRRRSFPVLRMQRCDQTGDSRG